MAVRVYTWGCGASVCLSVTWLLVPCNQLPSFRASPLGILVGEEGSGTQRREVGFAGGGSGGVGGAPFVALRSGLPSDLSPLCPHPLFSSPDAVSQVRLSPRNPAILLPSPMLSISFRGSWPPHLLPPPQPLVSGREDQIRSSQIKYPGKGPLVMPSINASLLSSGSRTG